ncbi:MAG TPA: hypothetical protein VI455_16885 [Terriglobia bacterium]
MGLTLLSAVRAPAIAHQDRVSNIERLSTEGQALKEVVSAQAKGIARLTEELAAAKKPRPDAIEHAIRSQVLELFERITQQEREILKEAIIHGGKIVAGQSLKASHCRQAKDGHDASDKQSSQADTAPLAYT